MPQKEHDQSAQASHDTTEPREMAKIQRISSSASQSRLAAAMAEMSALNSASSKASMAEMERLREENRSLRSIIQRLGCLEVVEESYDNEIQSVDGNSEDGVDAGPEFSVSVASSVSIRSGESNATISKHSTPRILGFETIAYSPPERVLERQGEFGVTLIYSRLLLIHCSALTHVCMRRL